MINKKCVICGMEGSQKCSGGWYCEECIKDILDDMLEDKREREEWYAENGQRVGMELTKEIENKKSGTNENRRQNNHKT